MSDLVETGPLGNQQKEQVIARDARTKARQRDEAFRWLNTSITERDPGLLWMHGNPLLRSLESDPRYAEILRKANLPR